MPILILLCVLAALLLFLGAAWLVAHPVHGRLIGLGLALAMLAWLLSLLLHVSL